MAEINESVYGAKENWIVPGSRTELGHQYSGNVFYYNDIAADDKLKIKVANFDTLNRPVTSFCSQMEGQYTSENYLIRNNWTPTQTDPIDRSIVQFGIGPQSGLADIEWWGVKWVTGQSEPTSSVDPTILNHDKYDIVNIGLGLETDYVPPMNYTAGSAANTTTGDMLITGTQYINNQIWGDQRCYFSTDSDRFYNYHVASGYAFLNFITQIPIKNLKIYPKITAYKSDTHWKQFNSIQDYLAEKNDYPLLGCIEAIFQYRSGLDNATVYNSPVNITPIFTDKTTVCKGYQNGTGENKVIRDENLWYSRSWRSHFVIAGRYGYGSSMRNDIYWVTTYDSRDYTYAIFDAVYQTPDFKFVLDANKCFTCDVSSMTDNQITEGIRKQLASFGMFFVDDVNDISLALDDDKTFLGILKNGVGYGDYSHGAKNREQDQWNWDTMGENTYDPENPPSPSEPETDPSGTPILPSDPGFTTAGKGTACYAMTYLDIDEMMEDIFGSTTAKYKELVEGLAMFGSNPMNAFVSCKWYPFVFNSPRNSPVILGSTIVNNNHQYDVIDGTDVSFKKFTGSVKIKADKNFVWSRRTKARLFLPFYGFYELPMNMLMSYTCQVEFHYNIPDEMAVWIISFGNVIYDFVECDPSIEVPLTGDNAREIMLTKRQLAAQYALKALGAVTLLATVGVTGMYGAEIASTAAENAVFSGAGVSFGGYLQAGGKALAASTAGTLASAGAGYVASNYALNNKIASLAKSLGNLSVNVPTHGGSGATTFLNLPLEPYIQLYQPAVLSDYNESEYKLKVGIACDKWCKISEMPENSLLKASGIANNSTSGMELAEIEELNAILQSGFYR